MTFNVEMGGYPPSHRHGYLQKGRHAGAGPSWLVRAPRWMVPADSQKPRWFTLHGPPGVTLALVRDDGRCIFSDEVSSVTYDPRLGIFAERPAQHALEWKDDDEFDN